MYQSARNTFAAFATTFTSIDPVKNQMIKLKSYQSLSNSSAMGRNIYNTNRDNLKDEYSLNSPTK